MSVLPHWTVNGKKITSQFDAWRTASELNTYPKFYFYEEEYDKLDWTKEPEETWDQLCYERCLSLRLKYKKLSLFYSAGRDSHHILRCFIRFNIPLDELILVDYTVNPERVQQLEDYITPKVQEYVRLYPNTKVTKLPIGQQEFDDFYKDDFLEKDASSLINGYFLPVNFDYYVRNMMHKDEPNHGFIVGLDKPRISYENNGYYSYVIDKVIEPFISNLPNVEMFYFAPEMPKLHLKQSWILLHHLENHYKQNTNQISNTFLLEYCGNSHSDYYDDYCIGCGRGDAWNVNLSIQNGKSKHRQAGREEFFDKLINWSLENNWQSARNFTEAMKFIGSKYPHVFNQKDPRRGTIGIYSKKYLLKSTV